MKIITAANAEMKKLAIKCWSITNSLSNKNLLIIYDLGGLGFGIPYDPSQDVELAKSSGVISCPNYLANSIWKPKVILDAMLDFPEEPYLVWMDADTCCIRDISMVFQFNFDIAVTIRPAEENEGSQWPMFDGYINAGVIFIKNNHKTRQLIQQWIDTIPATQTKTDQEALNMVLEAPKMRKHYRVYRTKGMIPKMSLPTSIYNNYYLPQKPSTWTRILHFKGEKQQSMRHFNQYFNQNE
jgi:hypothetical protein